MTVRDTLRLLGSVVTMAAATLGASVDLPAAAAEACPDSEVVFARGTGEPPGLGGVGEAFVDSIRSQIPGRSVAAYPVDYPAIDDYRNSALAGADDATAHVKTVVANCPNTKLVLGGYSQGASVIEFSTDSLPPQAANHVAAVALFGSPSSSYASARMGDPLPALAPAYRAKSIDLCIPGDIVCAEGGNMVPHLMYVPNGLADEAATFAVSRL